jgi:DNA-binding PadR family transcriptional regulator
MPSIKELQEGHVAYEMACIDRMYLNLRIPLLCTLGGMAMFLCKILAQKVPLASAFKPLRDEFICGVETFAADHGLEIHRFTKGENKEEIARQHLETLDPDESCVYFIGKAQEKVSVAQGGSTKNPETGRWWYRLRWGKVLANQYYFYIWDKNFGSLFIKFSSYAPFAGRACLNGHEYVKRQLEKEGIPYEPLDNGVRRCDDPKKAQRIANALSALKIHNMLKRWLEVIPTPMDRFPRSMGIKYHFTILQIEYALTQVWKTAQNGRQFFEQVIRENIDLGRPEKVGLIFKKRITKRTKQKRFMSRIMQYGTIPVFHIYYKCNKLKQYFKEAVALRNELTINNPRDFGIGKTLNGKNLRALCEVGKETINRLLRIETLSHDPSVSVEKLKEMETPAEVGDGKRVSALPRSNTKVRALLNALIGCHLICGGFRSKDLKSRLAQLLGKDNSEITTGQMSYHLRRLKGHGFIKKVEGTNRYEVTPEGLHIALFISQVERRVYQEGMSQLWDEESGGGVRRAYELFDKEVGNLFAKHHMNRAA